MIKQAQREIQGGEAAQLPEQGSRDEPSEQDPHFQLFACPEGRKTLNGLFDEGRIGPLSPGGFWEVLAQ